MKIRQKLSLNYHQILSNTHFISSAEYQLVYRKVPKFWDARKLCCDLPKIKEKRPNLRVFRQKDANGIANSEDSDQTARGAV